MVSFFKIPFSKNVFKNNYQTGQSVKIRTDILAILMLAQTVCKGYQHITIVASRKERVKIEVLELQKDD